MKSIEAIQKFLIRDNIKFTELNSKYSIKSNILSINRNLKSLTTYLTDTLEFIKNLYETVNIQSIVDLVLESLEVSKNILDINVNLAIGTSTTQKIGSKIYRILRVDNYQIIITGDNIVDWNTDNIITQVKTTEGMIVFPTIITKENKITLYFNDMVESNYKLFWI